LPASNSPKLRRRKLIGLPSATIPRPHDEIKGPGIIPRDIGAITSDQDRGSAGESAEIIAIPTGEMIIAKRSPPSVELILNPL